MKWCNTNGIFIYPILHNSRYKICVKKVKRIETAIGVHETFTEKIGEKEYTAQPKGKEENWADVIRELYKKYYEINNQEE